MTTDDEPPRDRPPGPAVLDYATPGVAGDWSGLLAWREGDALVVPARSAVRSFKLYLNAANPAPVSTLPRRCLHCGSPDVRATFEQQVEWHPWPLYLILLGFVPFTIVAVIVYMVATIPFRRRVRVRYCLCPEHEGRRRRQSMVCWAAGLFAAAVVVVAVVADDRWQVRSPYPLALFLIGGSIIAAAVVAGTWISRPLKARSIDAERAYLRGAAPAFLDTLDGTA